MFVWQSITAMTGQEIAPPQREMPLETVPADGPLEFIAVPKLGLLWKTATKNQSMIFITDSYTKLDQATPSSKSKAPHVVSVVFNLDRAMRNSRLSFHRQWASFVSKAFRRYVDSSGPNTSWQLHIILKLIANQNAMARPSLHVCIYSLPNINAIGIYSYTHSGTCTDPKYTAQLEWIILIGSLSSITLILFIRHTDGTTDWNQT